MEKAEPKKRVHVVAHTHWDRAWYWPFERFRLKLVECVKAVVRDLKASPEYRFSFDGQVLMLEDYLEVCPEDRGYLQTCAREGRIQVGPMYCLSDIYCTGGEALIRNLLIGMDWCEAFGGGYSRVLHMPDTFGITPCMPMIAQGFKMKAFTFMRGLAGQVPGLVTMEDIQGIQPQLPEGTRYFHWRAPDGSEITTIRLRHGYASAAASRHFERTTGEINFDRYVTRLQEAAKEWDQPEHEVVLLMAGVDHQIPWHRQAEAQARATELSAYAFTFSTLEDAADALSQTDSSEWFVCENNEFHGSGAASVLGGTLTARIYLKQHNAAVEQLLTHQCEPAIALALALGRRDPAFAALGHAWKTLLKTHPHDDICGCSVDAVHRKNESDMEQARESADALRRRAVFQLMQILGCDHAADPRPNFIVLNFQGSSQHAPTLVNMDFEGQYEWGDIQLPPHYRIVDETGAEVPYREVSRGQSVEHPRGVAQIELFAELPPARLKRFFIEEVPAPSDASGFEDEGFTAENEHLRVILHANGSFDLTRKTDGMTFRSLGLLSSQSDIGDTYDFSDIPEEKEKLFDNLSCERERQRWPGNVTVLSASGSITLPASVDSGTRTPSRETAALPFRQTLVLAPGARQIEIRIEFTNTAADHRLRWNLPLPVNAESSLAGIKFSTLRRPAGSLPPGDEAPRIFPEHPTDHFVAAGGLAVFCDFPRNYELVDIISFDANARNSDESRALSITLFRSVSYLTNPHQGATRPGTNAGPHTLTPEARCLGRHFQQRVALRPFADDEEDNLFFEASMWRAQPFVGQVDATMHCPSRPENRALAEQSFLRVEAPVVVRALKPAQDGNGIILRLQNTSAYPHRACLHSAFKSRPVAVGLDEHATEEWAPRLEKGKVILDMPPFALRTLRITT